MKVNLGGIVHLSTVDWPGRASMVVFLRGCPLRCPYCHNRDLQTGEGLVDLSMIRNEMKKALAFSCDSDQITLEESIRRARARPFISAFILSGGDPLMQPKPAAALLGTAKSLGLCTGIETSGYYPDRLSELLKRNVVDRVFLDIKAALREPGYVRATSIKGAGSRARKSLEICMSSGVPLEVRTTVFPEMPSPSEVIEIAETLSRLRAEFPGNRLESIVLQQGRPRDSEFEPVSLQGLRSIAESVKELAEFELRALPEVKLDRVENLEALSQKDGRTSV